MKIKQFIPLFLILFGIVLDYVAHWCVDSLDTCYGSLVHQSFDLLIPVYLFSVVVLPLAFFLIFVSSSIFNSWFKFARWWIPLSVLVILAASQPGSAMMPIYSFIQKDAVFLMSSLFVMVSVGIIVGKLLAVFLERNVSSSHIILRAWLKFVYFWVPFSLAFVLMPPLVHEFLEGYFFNFFGFPISLEYRAWFAGGLFAVISLGIIVWKTIALRKKN
ncbi:MAG: hypothetical protein KBC74_01525 [Candidatus Pacebacteria bacterium]|nr:hypothetical protein [Candidatus Paceibacterota bacterium]